MPILTVFTPAYNRAHTLPRTYASLRRQDSKDFVWLVVDDGSTDHTAELVKGWQAQETKFEIRYLYKENGGCLLYTSDAADDSTSVDLGGRRLIK